MLTSSSAIDWDRVVDLELLRHLSAVARRRGLTLGWLDAAGDSSLPHANLDESGTCPWAHGSTECDARLLSVLAEPGEWHIVEVH
ncbi:MAG: hypothetical protein F9K40_20420, partial [Kofleriaceae bacterium]